MSDVPMFELLDRVRRRVVAAVIRIHHMHDVEYVELTDAVAMLQPLIDMHKLKELPSATTRQKRRRDRRTADQQVPGGNNGHAEPVYPAAAFRDCESHGVIAGGAGEDRKEGNGEVAGTVDDLTAGPD